MSEMLWYFVAIQFLGTISEVSDDIEALPDIIPTRAPLAGLLAYHFWKMMLRLKCKMFSNSKSHGL
jgi:hypothetical protein